MKGNLELGRMMTAMKTPLEGFINISAWAVKPLSLKRCQLTLPSVNSRKKTKG